MIDGPYLQYEGDSVKVTWIDTGALHRHMVHKDSAYIFDQERLPSFSLQELNVEVDDEIELSGIENFIALSDIHGQFDVFEQLIRAHGIADDEGHWTFGEGHLIIVGDMSVSYTHLTLPTKA